jgi:hypothetical protein
MRFKDDHACNENLRSKNKNPDFYDENNEVPKGYPRS